MELRLTRLDIATHIFCTVLKLQRGNGRDNVVKWPYIRWETAHKLELDEQQMGGVHSDMSVATVDELVDWSFKVARVLEDRAVKEDELIENLNMARPQT